MPKLLAEVLIDTADKKEFIANSENKQIGLTRHGTLDAENRSTSRQTPRPCVAMEALADLGSTTKEAEMVNDFTKISTFKTS